MAGLGVAGEAWLVGDQACPWSPTHWAMHPADRLSFEVRGTPAAQGSKRYVGNGRMIEASDRVRPWRESVKSAALDAMVEQAWSLAPTGGMSLFATFCFARPKGHYGTGRNEGVLRASAPVLHVQRPDLDKLLRSTTDALSEAGVWLDDSQVYNVTATKRWDRVGGAVIAVVQTDLGSAAARPVVDVASV